MKKQPKTKRLSANIPTELFNMYAKKCIDENITMTEGLIRYFQYLDKTQWKWNKSKETFDVNNEE